MTATSTVLHSEPTNKFDIDLIRRDFPILKTKVHGKPLVYFDNAATGQRPQCVIDATNEFYSNHNANVHRAVHYLGEQATELFEQARETMQQFVNAVSHREIVFLRGVTEATNLVAQSFLRPKLKPGDEVLVSCMEHHSNLVPWQLVCEQTGAKLKAIPINQQGELLLEEFKSLLSDNVKFVAVTHVSNALGTINPIKELVALAHQYEIPVLVDGAQSAPHLAIDVQSLDCDFYCISSHKMYGPTGIGILYAKETLLEKMPPYQGGGEMVRRVTFDKTIYEEIPTKFEAGTPNIAGAVGMGAAAKYLTAIGFDHIAHQEEQLLTHATSALQQFDQLRIIGTAENKAAVISFLLDGVHAHDLGTVLSHYGIAIRTGHHCAMPVMDFFGVPATSRISMAFYNTKAEIDYFVDSLKAASKLFQ